MLSECYKNHQLNHRKEVYEAAKAAHPERWNGRETRNWDNIDKVFLNPDKVESADDKTIQQVS